MSPTPKLHPGVAALIAVVLIGTATGAVVAVSNQSKTASTNSSASSSMSAAHTQAVTDTGNSSSSTSTATSPAGASYKDGEYTATTTYRTPGGMEEIAVTLTVGGNTISKVDVSQQSDSRESEQYQSMFASAYQSEVVGKKVNEVSLSRVAGASLTSLGFNDALEKIKQDAAA